MAKFADDTAVSTAPRQKSYYELIVDDVRRCEPETRDKIMEAIEELNDNINNSAYTVMYDAIDEYEMEVETYDDQTNVVDDLKEILESNSCQRTLSLIYHRGKRIKYVIILNHS
jgi:hypothetical protein